MKKYKIYSLLFLLIASMSCTDQLREDEQELAEEVDQRTSAAFLLTGSIVSIATFNQKQGLDTDEFNAIQLYYLQLFSKKAQTHEEFEQAPENWNDEYKLLYDAKAGINKANELGKPSTAAAQMVLQSLMFQYLTDIYGDIPYSDALNGREGFIQPKFDAQQDIYAGLIATLDEAVTILTTSSDIIDGDLLYDGDKQAWIKFANSLQIRLLVRSYQAAGSDNQAKLQSLVSGGNFMTSYMDNAALLYEGSSDDNSWVWGISGKYDDFSRRKPSASFVDMLKANNDPRLRAWIAPELQPWGNMADAYTIQDYYGNDYGITLLDQSTSDDIQGFPIGEDYVGAPYTIVPLNSIYDESEVSGQYDNYKLSSYTNLFLERSHELLKATLFEASEVSFCLAEASRRGWITGNATTYYEDGVRNSMERWAISDADITNYIAANPLPGTNETDDLTTILTEKWKSMFTQGHQSWFEYRRTGVPVEVSEFPDYVTLPFPLRWRYPTVEKDNNVENTQAAIDRLGGDTQTDEIWIIKGVTPVIPLK